MEPVILDTLDADRLKSSQADVQGNLGSLDPTVVDALENLRRKVQTGCGRGN